MLRRGLVQPLPCHAKSVAGESIEACRSATSAAALAPGDEARDSLTAMLPRVRTRRGPSAGAAAARSVQPYVGNSVTCSSEYVVILRSEGGRMHCRDDDSQLEAPAR